MKVYNMIFPIWFLLFFPPVIFITLIGNFVIDSLVIVACFFIFHLSNQKMELKTFYKRSFLKVWLFGFLADIIGAAILFLVSMFANNELSSAISYDPFSSPLAVTIIIFAMLVSSAFIFILNYRFSFKELVSEKALRIKISLAIAIITIPWTFLIPTKWFF